MEKKDKSAWPAEIAAELSARPKSEPCVGTTLLSETERTRVWIIGSAPASASAFHRHVLDYFWTWCRRRAFNMSMTAHPRIHLRPGETRHETYGKDEFKVHDLQNVGDKEIVFMTVEFKDSANKPMTLPAGVRPQAAA